MKKSRRTYNGVHLNKKSNTQDVVEQSLTLFLWGKKIYVRICDMGGILVEEEKEK